MTPLSTLTRLVNKNFLRLQNSVKLRHSLLLQRSRPASALLGKIKAIMNLNAQDKLVMGQLPKIRFLGTSEISRKLGLRQVEQG